MEVCAGTGRGGAGGGLHMCVTMIATLHGEKQTPQETHIYPLAGKFYKPERSTFIRPLLFFFSPPLLCTGLQGGQALPRIL